MGILLDYLDVTAGVRLSDEPSKVYQVNGWELVIVLCTSDSNM